MSATKTITGTQYDPKYIKEMEFAISLAEQAGSLMTANLGFNTRAKWKADNSPVTQTDIDINKLVIEQIGQMYSDDGVLGEESSFKPERKRRWIVDPIDGTQAFDLGVPVSTFCLALVEDDEIKLGVVYDPYMKRMFTATARHGAYLNGTKLQVSDKDSLAQSYIILSSRMGEKFPTTGQLYDRVEQAKGKSFNFRSIVYGYMTVATGTAVAAVAGYLFPWDLAAAKVILEEAGARVTDRNGKPCRYNETANGVLVSNGKVHQQMLDLIHS